VNPKYREIGGGPCPPSLAALRGPVGLGLLGGPDAALAGQGGLAARGGGPAPGVFGRAVRAAAGGAGGGAGSRGPAGGVGGGLLFNEQQQTSSHGAAGAAGGAPSEPGSGEPGTGLPGATVSLRDYIAAAARGAGMALCGAGCMGFVNVGYGLRAIGYAEPDP